jgi:cyanophycinase
VVTGDKFEVIGKWKVTIHDSTRSNQPWEKSYFVLQLGDVYDMRARKVVKYGIGSPVPVTEIKKK